MNNLIKHQNLFRILGAPILFSPTVHYTGASHNLYYNLFAPIYIIYIKNIINIYIHINKHTYFLYKELNMHKKE